MVVLETPEVLSNHFKKTSRYLILDEVDFRTLYRVLLEDVFKIYHGEKSEPDVERLAIYHKLMYGVNITRDNYIDAVTEMKDIIDSSIQDIINRYHNVLMGGKNIKVISGNNFMFSVQFE